MDLRTEITVIYKQYSESIKDAHMKVLALEKNHKTRTSSDKEEIIKKIMKILEEATIDNK